MMALQAQSLMLVRHRNLNLRHAEVAKLKELNFFQPQAVGRFDIEM